jgi:deazaflavin-dependent oxidoreductase (nitroreductase family)
LTRHRLRFPTDGGELSAQQITAACKCCRHLTYPRRIDGASRLNLLTVEGRKTGRFYSTPVKLVVDGDSRWLVAPNGGRNWVKNVRAAGWVELSRAGKSERLHVTQVDNADAGPVLRTYLRHNPVTRTFFEANASDPVEAFIAEASRHAVFRLSHQDPRG